MEEKNYKVYLHICPNNKVYIGITKLKLENRWRKGEGYKNCILFYRAIKKYDWNNIKHIILYNNISIEEAKQQEIRLIKYYKSNNNKYGYNIDNGGNCIGSFSEIHRKKISKALKGIKRSKETIEKSRQSKIGKHTWNKGKNNIYSKETLKNMSKITKNLWEKEEYRDKLCKKIICIETNEIFYSINYAKKIYNIKSTNGITKALKNQKYSCGKLNNVKLHWKYIKKGEN